MHMHMIFDFAFGHAFYCAQKINLMMLFTETESYWPLNLIHSLGINPCNSSYFCGLFMLIIFMCYGVDTFSFTLVIILADMYVRL